MSTLQYCQAQQSLGILNSSGIQKSDMPSKYLLVYVFRTGLKAVSWMKIWENLNPILNEFLTYEI